MKQIVILILAVALAVAIVHSLFRRSEESSVVRAPSPLESFGNSDFAGQILKKYRDESNHLRAKLVLIDTVNESQSTVDITECLKLFSFAEPGDIVLKKAGDYRVRLTKFEPDTVVLHVECL